MCGIAGIVHWNNQSYVDTVRKMCDKMLHRGPDGGGIHQLDGICLGHRRLSIIDLSSGADQPMKDRTGRYWIVFNGEIYGFRQVKAELLESGHTFLTNSDTEVILEGFKKWGIEKLCVKLTGMFAFAIWDDQEKVLFLARDRFGEKPLYFLKDDKTFRFSSNANTLFIDNAIAKGLNPDGLVAFLNHSFVLPQYPMVENVQSLEPGQFMIVNEKNELIVGKYWNPSFVPKLNYEKDEWLGLIEDSIEEVIKQELVSDVKIGALLSGGVDSSLIASFATKIKPDIDLFTIRMPDLKLDESEIAKKVVAKIGGKHHIIDAEPISIDDFVKLQGQFSEPLGDSSAIAMWMVSREAKKHVTVVLSGDGGDELFAGYDTIKLNAKLNKYRSYLNNPVGEFFRVGFQKLLTPVSDRTIPRKILTLSNFVFRSMKESHIRRTFVPYKMQDDLYGERLLEYRKNDYYIKSLSDLWEQSDAEKPLDKLLNYDLHHALLGDFLPKVDIASMYHSLEARAPFLHHRLAEMAFQMPLEVKRLGGTQKGITKAILQKRLGLEASREVIKGKRGFVLPVDKWLDTTWRDLVAELSSSKLVKEGYLSKNGVEKVVKGYERYPETYSRIRYSLVALNSWSKTNL